MQFMHTLECFIALEFSLQMGSAAGDGKNEGCEYNRIKQTLTECTLGAEVKLNISANCWQKAATAL